MYILKLLNGTGEINTHISLEEFFNAASDVSNTIVCYSQILKCKNFKNGGMIKAVSVSIYQLYK